jgi:hypothetical protein
MREFTPSEAGSGKTRRLYQSPVKLTPDTPTPDSVRALPGEEIFSDKGFPPPPSTLSENNLGVKVIFILPSVIYS